MRVKLTRRIKERISKIIEENPNFKEGIIEINGRKIRIIVNKDKVILPGGQSFFIKSEYIF